jgi:hypothetical protein
MNDAQASDGKMIPHIADADPQIPNPLRLGEHPKKHRCQPALGLGADEKVVQRILRHAKSHVTKDRYIKAFDPAVLAAMKKLETTLDVLSQSAPIVHQIN